ncbi:hypothetical protein Bbelb_105140 [Branchiostoma belcheri]|nr:hypothetical protein Bbelb_105140 [Branchiostoma belcheri]
MASLAVYAGTNGKLTPAFLQQVVWRATLRYKIPVLGKQQEDLSCGGRDLDQTTGYPPYPPALHTCLTYRPVNLTSVPSVYPSNRADSFNRVHCCDVPTLPETMRSKMWRADTRRAWVVSRRDYALIPGKLPSVFPPRHEAVTIASVTANGGSLLRRYLVDGPLERQGSLQVRFRRGQGRERPPLSKISLSSDKVTDVNAALVAETKAIWSPPISLFVPCDEETRIKDSARNSDRVRTKWAQRALLQEFKEAMYAHSAYQFPKFLFHKHTGHKRHALSCFWNCNKRPGEVVMAPDPPSLSEDGRAAGIPCQLVHRQLNRAGDRVPLPWHSLFAVTCERKSPCPTVGSTAAARLHPVEWFGRLAPLVPTLWDDKDDIWTVTRLSGRTDLFEKQTISPSTCPGPPNNSRLRFAIKSAALRCDAPAAIVTNNRPRRYRR